MAYVREAMKAECVNGNVHGAELSKFLDTKVPDGTYVAQVVGGSCVNPEMPGDSLAFASRFNAQGNGFVR